MPKTIKNDRVATWEINGDNATWTLEKQASITVNNAAAIDVLDTSVANRLKLFGDVVATGDGSQGVLVSGVNTSILVGKSSEISADEGIHATANGLEVVNRGDIDGLASGISNSGASTIKNFGDISGHSGLSLLGTSKVVNGADGMIQGDFAGVIMAAGSDSQIINHGLISGNDFAIRLLNGGETKIINTGSIHGDVLFGIGDDLFDTRKGSIEGNVTGGGGDDVFKIGKKEVEIIEADDGGSDSVYAAKAHMLGDHIENLYLSGKGNASGIGNDEDNIIVGNKGDNTLGGGEGDDVIGGGRGDDLLQGGDDADTFIFNVGDDRDRIMDFVDGVDTIQMNGFEGIDSFADLATKMFKNGSGVWIQLGNGDRLIIDSADVSDFDASDFQFSVV